MEGALRLLHSVLSAGFGSHPDSVPAAVSEPRDAPRPLALRLPVGFEAVIVHWKETNGAQYEADDGMNSKGHLHLAILVAG
jgi:hypothetical protein